MSAQRQATIGRRWGQFKTSQWGQFRASFPLVGIARNLLGNSRRRGRVDDQARRRLGFEALELDDFDLERVLLIADEGRGEIAELVRSLPEPEREALHARVVEERGYGEIAEQLRCSELVVRKRVSRGLGRLRAQLQKEQR
jgi:RNA polymerase sigma factor (sigma-70 family)